ncbi:MAG TPA: bis(5'-nucleosyl)-tetraphosphatase (symmetrical) YqeK [Deinococcales bacterium]|nr:bis(5'-nucleosyl)-tetraphosphatase (symmetrical) YqeK [Deinococcales bacterium]
MLNLCSEPAFAAWCARVRSLVGRDRFAHVLRVTELAAELAEAAGFSEADLERVRLAALLHDAARELNAEQLMELAPPACQLEREHPLTLHGRAARALAESWGVEDEVVLGAIEGHVMGVHPDDHVGTVVYIADVSEPGRNVNSAIRELAFRDLPAAYRAAVRSKITYLEATGKPVHPATMRAYEAIRGAAD